MIKGNEGDVANLRRHVGEAVKRDLEIFAGEAEQFDDITMLGFRFNGYGEDTKNA